MTQETTIMGVTTILLIDVGWDPDRWFEFRRNV